MTVLPPKNGGKNFGRKKKFFNFLKKVRPRSTLLIHRRRMFLLITSMRDILCPMHRRNSSYATNVCAVSMFSIPWVLMTTVCPPKDLWKKNIKLINPKSRSPNLLKFAYKKQNKVRRRTKNFGMILAFLLIGLKHIARSALWPRKFLNGRSLTFIKKVHYIETKRRCCGVLRAEQRLRKPIWKIKKKMQKSTLFIFRVMAQN